MNLGLVETILIHEVFGFLKNIILKTKDMKKKRGVGVFQAFHDSPYPHPAHAIPLVLANPGAAMGSRSRSDTMSQQPWGCPRAAGLSMRLVFANLGFLPRHLQGCQCDPISCWLYILCIDVLRCCVFTGQ